MKHETCAALELDLLIAHLFLFMNVDCFDILLNEYRMILHANIRPIVYVLL